MYKKQYNTEKYPFAKIVAEVSESDNTDEAGKLSFYVAESDGTTTTLTAGLVLEGEHATNGEVDVTIGAGAESTTTIVGDLVVNGSHTTVASTTVAAGDNMFKFAKDNSANSIDIGWYGKIVSSGTNVYSSVKANSCPIFLRIS